MMYVRWMFDDDKRRLLNRLQEAVDKDFPQCELIEDDLYEIQKFALTHEGIPLEIIAIDHAKAQLQIQGLKPIPGKGIEVEAPEEETECKEHC